MSLPTHASSFSWDPDGSFSWEPAPGYLGGDSFRYAIQDRHSGDCHGEATVHIPPSAFLTSDRVQDDSFTVHAWDARGHGATGANPAPGTEPPTVERMARDLKQVIDHLGLESPLMVGHSMGALTL